jgi:hypothetical protein
VEVSPHLKMTISGAFEIDPELPQRQLRDFEARALSSRQAAMISNFREHTYQEMIGLDIDRLMATMVAEPALRYYGIGLEPDVGYDAVRKHYEKSFPSRAEGGVSLNIERLVVDDVTLFVEGLAILSSDFVTEGMGATLELAQPSVIAKRVAVVCPYLDGRMQYEAQYFDGIISRSDLVPLD